VTRQIKTVTNSAQRTAENIEKAVEGVSRAVSPMFLMKMVAKRFKKAKK
jgi:hypothetical protein